jgi:hypothetical protein
MYQEWAKTSWAKDAYWMTEEDESFPGSWNLIAVNQEDKRKPLAAFMDEVDADWIAAIHGSFGDVVRRLHNALDEADRLDYRHDAQSAGSLSWRWIKTKRTPSSMISSASSMRRTKS